MRIGLLVIVRSGGLYTTSVATSPEQGWWPLIWPEQCLELVSSVLILRQLVEAVLTRTRKPRIYDKCIRFRVLGTSDLRADGPNRSGTSGHSELRVSVARIIL
jgi:hypothetical protein